MNESWDTLRQVVAYSRRQLTRTGALSGTMASRLLDACDAVLAANVDLSAAAEKQPLPPPVLANPVTVGLAPASPEPEPLVQLEEHAHEEKHGGETAAIESRLVGSAARFGILFGSGHRLVAGSDGLPQAQPGDDDYSPVAGE